MDEPQRKIEDLAKYIPFINYLLNKDRVKYQKMGKIKQWIIQKKRYASEVIKTMENSMVVQYRNQFMEDDVKMPKEILEIFNKSVGYSIVNLCSDEDDETDESDDDVICISPTPKSNTSKKHDSEFKDEFKDEKPCKSSSILQGTESIKKTETDAQDETPQTIVIDESPNKNKEVLNTSSSTPKSNTSKKHDSEYKDEKPCKSSSILRGTESIKKTETDAQDETPQTIVIDGSPNKNKEVSNTSSIAVDADDDAAFFERIDKVCILSDQSNDSTDTESLCTDFDFLTTFINQNKPKDKPTDVDIKMKELFTRRQKTDETSCTIENRHDELRQNVNVDTVVYSLSESEKDMGSIMSDYNSEPKKAGTSKIDNEKVEGAGVQLENKLEMLDINELDTILKKLTSNNNFDLEQCLMELVAQTQIENVTTDTTLQSRNPNNPNDVTDDTTLQSRNPDNPNDVTKDTTLQSRNPDNPNYDNVLSIVSSGDNFIAPPPRYEESFTPPLTKCSPDRNFDVLSIVSPRDNFIAPPPPENSSYEESFTPPLTNCSPDKNFDVLSIVSPRDNFIAPPTPANSSYEESFTPPLTNCSPDKNFDVLSIVSPIDNFIAPPPPANSSTKESFTPPLANCLPNKSVISMPPNFDATKEIPPPQPRYVHIENLKLTEMASLKFDIRTPPPTMHQFPTAQQIPHQQIHVPPPNFQLNDGRNLNLNDPRIVRQLQILQNSPISSTIREMATSLTNYTQTVQHTKKPAAFQKPATYGEYKRRKAELRAEAERKEAAHKKEVEHRQEAEQRKKAEKKRETERLAEERQAEEQRAAERVAEVKRTVERLAEEKRDAERLAEVKRTAERLAEEKRTAERLAEEQRSADRLAKEKRAAKRLAKEKRAAKRLDKKKRADAEHFGKEKRLSKQTDDLRQMFKDYSKMKIVSTSSEHKKVHKKVDNKIGNKIFHSKPTIVDSTTYKDEQNTSKTPKTPKKVGRKSGGRKSYYNDLPESPPATPTTDKDEKDNLTPSKLPRRSAGRPAGVCKTTRVLKSLECSFIGFNELQDYIPESVNGKRRSSEFARNAIIKQLSKHAVQYEDSTDDDLYNNNVVNNELPLRRSTCSPDNADPFTVAAPFTSPRKISLELDESPFRAAPILNRRKECDEPSFSIAASLGVARSSSPIVNYLPDSSLPTLVNTYVPQDRTSVDRISSSSDTDIFDLNEFKQKDEEKKKKRCMSNQPVVRLKRYSAKKIEKLLKKDAKPKVNNNKPMLNEEVLSVQLVQAACAEKPEKLPKKCIKPTKQVKNVLSAMTERNTRYCVLCKSKPYDLVNHYVKTHKCEPYVARLTEDELRDLQINWPSAIPCASNAENPRILKYEVKCLFCDDTLIDSFINFHNHFATHTGEYGFQCENCKLQKPFRADIQSHKYHSKACRNSRLQTMYVYSPDLMAIYLYCCKLCNFVQLNEANVHKHLREHHDQSTSYNSTLVQKYIAAAINDAEIVNEASQESGEMLEDEVMNGIPTQIQNTAECKQELILEELANMNTSEKNGLVNVATTTNTTAAKSTIVIANVNNTNNAIVPIELPRPIIIKLDPGELEFKNNMDLRVGESLSQEIVSAVKTQNFSQTLQTTMIKSNEPPVSYRLYTPDTPYFGLFKCRATDCLYSTNESLKMLTHLNDHSTSECPPTGYLDCSYCMLQPNQCPTAETLIKHIMDRHYYSCFQCSKCAYRSCIPGNVLLHKRIVHDTDNENSESEEFVYVCEGSTVTVNERLGDMKHFMEQNVPKLQCNYCHHGFYALSNLSRHLVMRHHVVEEYVGEYVCIYCGRNTAIKKDMQSHLALKHPDELAYTCLRVLQDAQKEDDVSNLLLWDIKEDVVPANLRQTSVQANDILSKDTNVILRGNKVVEETSSIVGLQDLKPSFEQLEQTAVDSLGSLLSKLTAKTGLPPDILYQCAEKTCSGFFSNHELWSRHMKLRHNCSVASCPHCPDRKEFAVADFSQHFEEHCRHLYVCFQCGMSYVSDVSIVGHYQLEHSTTADAIETRFETIKFNIRYSYYILINEQFYPQRLEFLEALRVNIIKRLDQLATEEKSKLLSKWTVPRTAEWLENFPIYSYRRRSLKLCFDTNCTYKTVSDTELVTHLKSRHAINNMNYQCSKCPFFIANCNNWDQLFDHVEYHKSNIYACCVCSFYHYQRAKLMAHIKTEHNSRDVPIISLERSVEGTYVSIGVVLVTGRKILTTKRQCFFCTYPEMYIKHLKTVHNVYLKYQCELCLAPLENLVDVDEHFKSAHMGLQITISCEFISDDQVEVCQIRPLKLNAANAIASAIAAKRAFDNNNTTTLYSNNKRLRIASPKISDVKKELLDDDDDGSKTDSSVEIIEDDDIVYAAELNTCNSELNITAAPKIKLKNLSDLLSAPGAHIEQSHVAIASSWLQIQDFNEFTLNNGSLGLPPSHQTNVSALGAQIEHARELLSNNSLPATSPLGIQIKNFSESGSNRNATPINLLGNTYQASTSVSITPFTPNHRQIEYAHLPRLRNEN